MLDGINEMLLKILITGEPGVGKTQLIDSFLGSLELEIGINDFFNQKVENCQHDILLLTFNIVNPQSLELASIKCSALSRLLGPSVPLLLIGCKSDLVTNHSVLSKLSAQGVTPVSRLKALSIAQKLGASLYIETETVFKKTSSTAAFEAAALTVLGHFQEQPKTIKDRVTSPPRDQSPYEFWNTVVQPQRMSRLRKKSLSINLLFQRNSIKNSNYNVVINLPKAKAIRSRSYNDEREQFKQIKCQRINNKNDLEEIEIFVPMSVHQNLTI